MLVVFSAAPPGQPRNITVESIGATWACVHWDPLFMANTSIMHYEIIAHHVNADVAMVNVTTAKSNTCFNVTGLLPGTTYEWTV